MKLILSLCITVCFLYQTFGDKQVTDDSNNKNVQNNRDPPSSVPNDGKTIAKTDSHVYYDDEPQDPNPIPLKIYPIYTGYTHFRDFTKLRERIIEPAIKYWEKHLKVKFPQRNRFLIERACQHDQHYGKSFDNGTRIKTCFHNCLADTKCGNYVLPQKYLRKCRFIHLNRIITRGNDGTEDFRNGLTIVINRKSPYECASNNGYATVCFKDPETDRPIFGSLDLCMNPNENEHYLGDIALVQHEIGHILGFSHSQFPYIRDDKNLPVMQRSGIFNDVTTEYEDGFRKIDSSIIMEQDVPWEDRFYTRTVKKHFLVTPLATEAAREHFDCDILPGVELEDDGGSGTRLSHLEMRIYKDDVLAPMITGYHFGTIITMAFLQDTNWYDVDFSKAAPNRFGKKLGCDFAMKSCYTYKMNQINEGKSIFPWCETPSEESCISDNLAKGYCAMQIDHDPQYQMIEDDVYNYGGIYSYMDGCATYNTIQENVGDKKIESDCKFEKNNFVMSREVNRFGERFGRQSICVAVNGTLTSIEDSSDGNKITYKDEHPKCLKYECENDKLLLHIFNQRFDCNDDKFVQVNITNKNIKLQGSFKCPEPQLLCGKFFTVNPKDLNITVNGNTI